MATFQAGDRIRGPRGLGYVVEVRRQQPAPARVSSRTLRGFLADAAEPMRESPLLAAVIGEALIGGFYSADRYPYRVCFDDGYSDVYSDNSLTLVRRRRPRNDRRSGRGRRNRREE